MSTPSENPFGRLIHEIHRRSLWQVLAIYVVGGWIAFEVVQTLTEGLGLPAWFPALAIVLLIIGLPIVLATAFVQEGAPERGFGEVAALDEIFSEEEAERPQPRGAHRLFTWRNAILGGVAAFALWGVLVAGWVVGGGRLPAGLSEGATASDGSDAAERSVAVLPFENMSADPDNEYFSDGITEEILNALTQVQDLRVPGRTSSFSFKGTDLRISQIADTLGVTHVVEGSVRRAGDRVRITAQLIDARDDEHLWSDTYERRLEDVFAVQSEIARSITDALEVRLAGGDTAHIAVEGTDSPEAHDAYLRGRYFWNRRTAADLHTAIDYFERAIDLDPAYAPAHAGLADARILLPSYEPVDDLTSVLRRARVAARRALELNPELAEAHTSLAYVHTLLGEWEEAERAFRSAIALNPGYATAHQWYSNLLAWTGRTAEGVERGRRAVELDPLSRIKNRDLVMAFLYDGDFDAAARWSEKAIELAPEWPLTWGDLAIARLEQGRFTEATDAWMRFARGMEADTAVAREVFRSMVRFQETGELQPLPANLEERLHIPNAYFYIFVYPYTGQWDLGFRAIEEDIEEGFGLAGGLILAPWWDPASEDPRYRRILERAGL